MKFIFYHFKKLKLNNAYLKRLVKGRFLSVDEIMVINSKILILLVADVMVVIFFSPYDVIGSIILLDRREKWKKQNFQCLP